MGHPLYEKWLAKALPRALPSEPFATCDNCTMCVNHASSPTGVTFRPDTKCCSFSPRLPNYAVGGILLDDAPGTDEGRRTLRQRLTQTSLSTPLGLCVDPIIGSLYQAGSQEAFGRSEALRCPHYSVSDGGKCTIWRHRNAVCYTWFCKHERGKISHQFWGTLRDFVTAIEDQLSIWCALSLGVLESSIVRCLALRNEALGTQVGRTLASSAVDTGFLWGSWIGKEEEFYSKCAKLVQPLAWDEVSDICGPVVMAYLGAARAELEMVAVRAPIQHPTLGGYRVERHSTKELRLSTYSPYNPLIVPAELPYLLQYFDGSPVDETLARIKEEQDVDFGLELVQRLLDFGVLEERKASIMA
jgi:hypothetical protein